MNPTEPEEMSTPKLVRELIEMKQDAVRRAAKRDPGTVEQYDRMDAVVTELIRRGVLD